MSCFDESIQNVTYDLPGDQRPTAWITDLLLHIVTTVATFLLMNDELLNWIEVVCLAELHFAGRE